MKVKLLRKVRRRAEYIFYDRIFRFTTTNGRVTGLSYDLDYEWAIEWMFDERLDYQKDAKKIIRKISHLLWEHSAREYWTGKLKKVR